MERSYNALRLAGTLPKAEGELTEGAQHSTLAELTAWTQWADKMLVF